MTDFNLLPRIFLLPLDQCNESLPEMHTHNGDEFIFVLEGSLTLYIDGGKFVLSPEDSIQIHSQHPHNWIKNTNKITKFLPVNYPNPFLEETVISEFTPEPFIHLYVLRHFHAAFGSRGRRMKKIFYTGTPPL